MNKFTAFFRRSNAPILAGVGVGVMLLVAIVVTIVALAGGSDNNTSDGDNGGNLSSGNVSGLSGGTSSYRNLKGLTIRINQIETCNPNVVSAYVAVSSDDGVVNKNFSKQDVSIYLDGSKINEFKFDPVDTTKTPLTNVLTIDHSGSMSGAPIQNAKSAAVDYVGKLQKGDQVGVVQFDTQIDTLAPLTTNKRKAVAAINTIQPRGDTALYDALKKSVSLVPDCGRKAVTVLTDGDDTASNSASESSVIKAANKANLPIFSVGLKGKGFDDNSITNISDKTGGQYLEANKPSDIKKLYSNINGQLTGQFVANLQLDDLKKNGSTHTLKVISNVEGSPTSSQRSFVY